MSLVKITELSRSLGISSRSLRYYEQVGLIRSQRPAHEKYRFYDGETIGRIKQIMVLRKMQIPIRDILGIYESQDMKAVVEAFVSRISAIDREVTALSDLRRIVNDFLQTMLQNGVTKISALPLLYEEMEKQAQLLEGRDSNPAYGDLAAASEMLEKPPELRILSLPPMNALLSIRRDTGVSDVEGFWDWLSRRNISLGAPGQHRLFEYQDAEGQTILMQRMDGGVPRDCPYGERFFPGGLFAVGSLYVDEDMGAFFRRMIESFDGNPYYEADYLHGGRLRSEPLLETVLSPDRKREKVELYLPVKSRLPDASLYDPGKVAATASVREIEEANPILWEKEVPMDGFSPILSPFYRVNGTGEAEFIPYIAKRRLSTQVAVRIPFRVDLEFRVEENGCTFAHGSDEGSIRFYHGSCLYGINMENNADHRLSQEAVCFHQPVFGDYFRYPGLGRITPGEYNHLTWIVGEAHFAVILNGAVRFCGVDFPYMQADLRAQPEHPIVLGSNGQGKKFFRGVRISQLKDRPKTKLKKGALSMGVNQSNNSIPIIHPLVTLHHGENYWFNGCAKYVMEALGRPEFDYWFFSGLTGDNLAQVFSHDGFRGDGATDYRMYDGGNHFIEHVFAACGYASTYVGEEQLAANREMYLQTLIGYIDKGVPVIFNNFTGKWNGGEYGPGWGVFVGYEDYGQVLLYLSEEMAEPVRVSLNEALPRSGPSTPAGINGWAFVGEKVREEDGQRVYRDVVLDMLRLLTEKTTGYCFGGDAFRAWADSIEGGRFDGMRPEEFEPWPMHTIYVCNVATNGSCRAFLERALEGNPDMVYLEGVIAEYRKLAVLWNGSDGEKQYTDEHLESLGGGFNVTLNNLQDKGKRRAIADKIREGAGCMDRVLDLLRGT